MVMRRPRGGRTAEAGFSHRVDCHRVSAAGGASSSEEKETPAAVCSWAVAAASLWSASPSGDRSNGNGPGQRELSALVVWLGVVATPPHAALWATTDDRSQLRRGTLDESLRLVDQARRDDDLWKRLLSLAKTDAAKTDDKTDDKTAWRLARRATRRTTTGATRARAEGETV
eukprot:Selendium_serpulae@DN6512_c1_g2_i1.p1